MRRSSRCRGLSAAADSNDFMSVRTATREDIAAMMRLASASPGAAIWTEEQYREIFDPGATVARYAVIFEEAGGIAGFAVARTGAEDWELENIVVQSANQRMGYGALLLQALIERARIAGVKHFEKCGFRVKGLRRGYYQQPAEDAILYRQDLTTAPAQVQSASGEKIIKSR